MNIEEIIRALPEQFAFEPTVERCEKIPAFERVVVGGMGGSNLPAQVITTALPNLPLFIHHDYGVPPPGMVPHTGTLFVAISYSGNTEETIDFAREALKEKLPLAVISSGGVLQKLAQEHTLPFALAPQGPEGFQPRMAIAYLSAALLSVLGKEHERKALADAARNVSQNSIAEEGRVLGKFFAEGIPLVYSSEKNKGLAYYFKALLNETPKLPAFINQFPELNHNEMLGVVKSKQLREFRFLLFRDSADGSRVQRRMEVFATICSEAGGVSRDLHLSRDPFERIVQAVLTANWMALKAARIKNVDPFDISLVETFKNSL